MITDVKFWRNDAVEASAVIADRMGEGHVATEIRKLLDKVHGPTHHAVIDEYGEIIYARRISGLLDAVEQCEYYIEQCRKDPVTRHSAKGWTVKEVTLHE